MSAATLQANALCVFMLLGQYIHGRAGSETSLSLLLSGGGDGDKVDPLCDATSVELLFELLPDCDGPCGAVEMSADDLVLGGFSGPGEVK